MTTSNINPVAGAVFLPGDSFSFDLNDGGTTPSSIQVSIEGAGTTVAWTLASGFGSGYSGTSVKVGNVYSITVSKGAGWDASPFTVNVDWAISGTPSTSSWSYELANESLYPDLMQPRNPLAQGAPTGSDTDAIHDNVAGEISALPLVTAASGDHILIEDASDSDEKKRVAASDFLAAGTDSALSGAGAPGVSTGDGYPVGSVYADTTADESYTLTDNTAGSNVWSTVTGGGVGTTNETQARYAFDDSVADSDPGAGLLRYNNATFGSVTSIFVDDLTAGAVDNSDLWSTIGENDFILIGNQTTPSAGALFLVGASPTVDGTGYFKLNVSAVSGTLPAAGDELAISIVRASATSPNTSGVDTWTLSSISGANTSAGEASFNSATAGSVTSIKVAYQSIARTLEPWLQGIAVGDFFIIRETGGAKGLTKRVTAVTDDPGNSQVTYTVSEVTGGSSGSFAGTETLDIDLLPGPGKLSGAGAPGVSTGDGYPLGTTYADTTNDIGYVLVDDTAGVNVWWTGGAGTGLNTQGFGEWKFDTVTTDSDPGAGKWRLNNANEALATFIYIDDLNDAGLDTNALIENLMVDGAYVYIQRTEDSTEALLYEVTAAPTDGTGYWKVPVTYLSEDSGGWVGVLNKKYAFIALSPPGGAGGGDVTGPGASVLANAIASYSGTGGLTIKEANVLVGAGSVGTGTRTLGTNSILSGGYLASAGSSVVSSGDGAVSLGYATGASSINSTGLGSVSIGYVSESLSGTGATITNSGLGAFVVGATAQSISGTATLNATSAGVFVGGYAAQGGLIEAVSSSNGCFSHGYTTGAGSIIRVTGAFGAVASGSAKGGGTIIASDDGAFATGSADVASGGTSADIAASGLGSFAGGDAQGVVASGVAQITASGRGAFAWGSVLAVATTVSIAATATNSVQFGLGTNSTANSLQVGSGVKLLGPLTTAPAGLADGMIWTGADGKMRCRTNGTTRLLGVGAT